MLPSPIHANLGAIAGVVESESIRFDVIVQGEGVIDLKVIDFAP